MLYVTTKNKHDAYTAYRTLHADRGTDGGLFMPFRMVNLDRQQVLELRDKSFGQCVAETLNRFFSCGLTGWDVEFCIGRYPTQTVDVGHRILVAQTWHNQAWDYAWAERTLAEKLCGDLPEGQVPAWVKIAIRVAFLTGVFGQLLEQGAVSPENPMDVAVPGGDFSIPMSVWYARQMGLPIANIICGCADNSPAWDLLHLGTVKTEENMPAFLEQLICETLGHKEAQRYGEVCADGGVYSLLPVEAEKLRRGMFAGVVSQDRVETLISNVYNTDAYILGPKASIAYGGLLDYRAKTGANRMALLLAERSPVCDGDLVAKAMGITKSELREKLQ